MRIAVIHSYYSSKQPSGENVAVDSQADLLRAAGHDVVVVAQRTDELEKQHNYSMRAALTVATGRGPSPIAELQRFRPDVVHVHNLHPNWGTRWLAEWEGPLVATLHNFRPLCAVGTLVRDGAVCTKCPDGDPWAGVKHHCFRDSAVRTLPLAVSGRGGVTDSAIIRRADRLITLSERTRDIYDKYGVSRDRMALIPNFVVDLAEATEKPARKVEHNGRWLFVGRLTSEKGLLELLNSWPTGEQLDVIGDGPLAPEVRRRLPQGSQYLGAMSQSDLRAILPNYAGLVLPSRWPESAVPLVAIEAFSAGVPVAALVGNAAADLLDTTNAGVVVRDDRDWARALDEIRQHRQKFAKCARRTYQERFQPQVWLDAVTSLYAGLSH